MNPYAKLGTEKSITKQRVKRADGKIVSTTTVIFEIIETLTEEQARLAAEKTVLETKKSLLDAELPKVTAEITKKSQEISDAK